MKPIPEFSSEAEERAFWESADSTDYLDWSKAEKTRLPSLKPTLPQPVRQVTNRANQ